MKIQINTDNHIAATEALVADIENKLTLTLKRFEDQINRVEVHLSDINSAKSGPNDKRCLIEARVAGMNPIATRHEAPTVSLAIDGATDRMLAALDSALGKRREIPRDAGAPPGAGENGPLSD